MDPYRYRIAEGSVSIPRERSDLGDPLQEGAALSFAIRRRRLVSPRIAYAKARNSGYLAACLFWYVLLC